MNQLEVNYPATKIGHWPTGAIPLCNRHADAMVRIGQALGMHVPITDPAPAGSICTNCVNELSKRTKEGTL